VRDRGTDGDPTIILKKDLDAAKNHKRRIIERVGAIHPGECPFEIEIFHLVPANVQAMASADEKTPTKETTL
jgi:hypothetical protein